MKLKTTIYTTMAESTASHDRNATGQFKRALPSELRDEMGNRLVMVDLQEVERRLKARSPE